jgi:hypothetical protein
VLAYVRMKWALLAAGAIIGYQILCPPIIGIADQGDFRRVIGKFGYGPEQPAGYYEFVAGKYVRDPNYRLPDWEQASSEDLFVAAAVLAGKIASKDGTLDIRFIGVVHALAFLAALAWLLSATRSCRNRIWIWIGVLFITTDVAYVSYFNTFYAEPASYVACILLLAESIAISTKGASAARIVRWSFWAIFLVLAKPANAPIGLLLAAYAIRLGWPSKLAWAGAAAILSAVAFIVFTAPSPMMDVNTYDMVFSGVLPESKTPAADAVTLGLEPGSEVLSGTAAWSTNSAFSAMRVSGMIGKKITSRTVLRFYLTRPARAWRHIRRDLQVAMLLRPPLGNFVRSSGYPPVTQSSAFSIWSDFHQYVLLRFARFLFLLLPVPALIVMFQRFYKRQSRLEAELVALLALCCMTSFLTASFADAWETVKHMFLFNALLDACLLTSAAFALTLPARVTTPKNILNPPKFNNLQPNPPPPPSVFPHPSATFKPEDHEFH